MTDRLTGGRQSLHDHLLLDREGLDPTSTLCVTNWSRVIPSLRRRASLVGGAQAVVTADYPSS